VACVLIVDDDRQSLAVLESSLRQAGLETTAAPDANSALEQVRQRPPDLVLLDLGPPDPLARELCRRLKGNPATRHLPVVMVSVHPEETDRVAGLELGVDDCVSRPFSVRELVLRVKAVLRRSAARSDREILEVGPIRVDPGARRVWLGKTELRLTALEFDLLALLVSRAGRVQSRDQLLGEVWKTSSGLETRTVDTHVKRLRAKLGPARGLLQTVRGVGYRLVDPSAR
jgi:two-component system phosphate regulon response regulator PhoB